MHLQRVTNEPEVVDVALERLAAGIAVQNRWKPQEPLTGLYYL
jgi:hypothetical protein